MIRAGLMFDDFERCESPIEALLQLAMASVSMRGQLEWCNARAEGTLRSCVHDGIIVGSQIWMMGSRLDYVFAQGEQLLGVECDGRDFHHGDPVKQSADRHRDIKLSTGRGLTTLRLTGSEIKRNPLGAVNECIEHVGRLPRGRTAKAISQSHYDLVQMPLKRRALAREAFLLTPMNSQLTSTQPQSLTGRAALAATMRKVETEGWTPIKELLPTPKIAGPKS